MGIVGGMDAPGPLRKVADAGPRPSWLVAHLAGLIALTIGVLGFAIVSLTQTQVWAQPDWRITVPFLVATVAAAAVAIARREGTLALGSVQRMGFRHLPLLQVHVTESISLDLHAQVRRNLATGELSDAYLAGGTVNF